MKKISTFLILTLALPALLFAQTHHDWSYNLSIYEVNVRQYTEEGTFAAFEEHLDRLEDLGVGILWLMPIHPIGEENRLGSLGSYYSVKDFFDINPEFGDLEDFGHLVEQIHERGMYVILDWVANHTAWDHPLTETNPEWYELDNNGNFMPPPGTNWSDVIQLDFSEPGLREYMTNAMKFWVEEFNIDGFRYDAAGYVPMDYWEEAIEELRDLKPDIFLLAEDNGPEWHEAGFDMSFGWDMYGFGHGVLINIAEGTNSAAHLNTYLDGQINNYPSDAYRMYFTSNHDENSWYGTTEELFGDAAEVFAVLTATVHGMPLIYSGQEAGLDKRLAFFNKDEIEWRDHPKADLYRTLFHLKRDNQALWNGEAGGIRQRVSTSLNASTYAYLREKNGDRVFVAMNLTDQERSITLNGDRHYGTYRDVFSDEIIQLDENTSFTFAPWDYVVYEGTDSGVSTEPENRPYRFSLDQNYPNPFNPSTQISFELDRYEHVNLSVYDVLGRQIQVLVSDDLRAGKHTVRFDASRLSSGVYIYVLQAGNQRISRTMMLVK